MSVPSYNDFPVREREPDEPRDATELLLLDLFGESTGAPYVRLADDFFDLGGNSVGAVHLLTRLRERTGKGVTLGDVLRHPTPEALAVVVRAETTSDSSCVVELHPGPPDRDHPVTLVAVHPLGGGVMWYRHIAAALGDAIPSLGIQAAGLDPSHTADPTIEDMARRYVNELHEYHGDTRYLLLGYSFGGLVAYEMTQILSKLGSPPEGVLMLDTGLSGGPTPPPTHARLLWSMIGHGLGVRVDINALATMEENLLIDSLLQAGKSQGAFPPDFGEEALRRLVSVYPINSDAARAYSPSPYDGPADLARVHSGQITDAVLARWRTLAADLTLHDLTGDHLDLLAEENAPTVAAIVRRRWLGRV